MVVGTVLNGHVWRVLADPGAGLGRAAGYAPHVAEQHEAGHMDAADPELAELRARVERGGAPRYHQSAAASGKLFPGPDRLPEIGRAHV